MKRSIYFAMITLGLFASLQSSAITEDSRELRRQINRLLNTVASNVGSENYDDASLRLIRDHLQAAAYVENAPAAAVCMKAGNSRYYPTDIESGRIIGSVDFNAGHPSLNECKATLASSHQLFACYKMGNTRYYPSHPATGVILGSPDYNAGHPTHNECARTIPERGQKVACFKQGNGRYYVCHAETGKIIGSDDYMAGHAEYNECLEVIN